MTRFLQSKETRGAICALQIIGTPVALSQGLAFRILPETTTIRLALSVSAEENKKPLLKAQEEEKSIPASHLPDNE
jgi:hypothetical protein